MPNRSMKQDDSLEDFEHREIRLDDVTKVGVCGRLRTGGLS